MSEAAAQSRGSYLADNAEKSTCQGFCCCQVSLQMIFLDIIYQYRANSSPEVWTEMEVILFPNS